MLIDIGEIENRRPGDQGIEKGKGRLLLHVPDEELPLLFDQKTIQKLMENRKCLIL